MMLCGTLDKEILLASDEHSIKNTKFFSAFTLLDRLNVDTEFEIGNRFAVKLLSIKLLR